MDEDLKRCSKCENKQVKLNSFKDITKKHSLRNQCINCTKHYHYKNREKKNQRERRRRINDVNYRLIKNTRRRIQRALKGKSKSFSTIDILGIDINTYKSWREFQMTPEMNWSNTEIDHLSQFVCLMYLMMKN